MNAPPVERLSLRARIVFSVLSTLLGLGALEGIAREVAPPVARVGQFMEVDPFIPDVADPSFLVTQPRLTDAQGRWEVVRAQRFPARKPDGHLRILLVGGSSVYQLQDQIESLRSRLATSLRRAPDTIEIVNGGANAQGSAGVRHMVESTLPYGLDAIVVYCAHNEYAQHLVGFEGAENWQTWLAHHSALAGAIQHAVDTWRLHRVEAARATADVPMATTSGTTTAGHRVVALEVLDGDGQQKDPPNVVAAHYQQNLEAIVSEARAAGVAVVLCSVPSNLVQPAWPGTPPEVIAHFTALRDAGQLAEAAAFADDVLSKGVHVQSTHVENDILRALAARDQVPLADVQQAIVDASPHHVSGETMFADHCHMNRYGRAIWVDTVAPVLATALTPP